MRIAPLHTVLAIMLFGAAAIAENIKTFDRDLQISGFSTGWGAYRFGGSRSGSVRTEEILIGAVAVDIVNNRAAERLVKNYPPQK
jgi:hypothetical protein